MSEIAWIFINPQSYVDSEVKNAQKNIKDALFVYINNSKGVYMLHLHKIL